MMLDTQQAEPNETANQTNGVYSPTPDATAADGVTPDGPALDESAIDDGATFLADLAKAMQSTASAERDRTVEATEQRRQAEIDRIRGREVVEADRMRSLAEEDRTAIDTWADGEVARIEEERARRGLALDADLAASLEDHRVKIAAEIDAIEVRIAAYRGEVDAYFQKLDGETDPIAIARQASERPVFPSLTIAVAEATETPDVTGATDATEVVAEAATATEPGATEPAAPALVGVMDPAAAAEALDPALAAVTPGPFDAEPEESALVEEAPAPTGLLQAVPALRPSTSWLRRDKD